MRSLLFASAVLSLASCDAAPPAHEEAEIVALPPAVAENETGMTVICVTGDAPIQYALVENVPIDPRGDVSPTFIAIRDAWTEEMRAQGRLVEADGALAARCAVRSPEKIPDEVDRLQALAEHNGGLRQIDWSPRR